MGLDNPLHILIIAIVLILIFGAKRVPQIGRSAGKGLREFKSAVAMDEITSAAQTVREPLNLTAATPPAAPERDGDPPVARPASPAR